MSDRYEALRTALAEFDADPYKRAGAYEAFGGECLPDTIRELLRERDALIAQDAEHRAARDALIRVSNEHHRTRMDAEAERDALLGLLGEARKHLPLAAASWHDDTEVDYSHNVDEVLGIISRIDAAISQEKEEGK